MVLTSIWQEGWIWALLGIGLAIAELLLPGFFLLGFAIGALIVAALTWVGLLGASLPLLVLIFAVTSLLAWVGLRKAFPRRAGQVKIWDRDINED
ncbi:hypothetical protein BFP70_17590 [Thioclava sp. SK-1]|uniref:NfeD family protein n=1 Tax=Thioclava sp. SK-1 TaxID=1889770 RepID=UPI000824ED33|nr:hypothetical protein [Thioclava sp. SK-1]OCX60424.1 hypothetical protein BFP70_17590 [Thioclava sp. SK-1]